MTAPRTAPLRVVVLCTGNSARSQIAEALLATRGAGRVVAASAGSRPAARVNPFAVEVLARHGITWDGGTPKTVDAVTGEPTDLVITVCGNANEACPVLPGVAARVHWGLPDPADAPTPDAARRAFEATYAALDARITRLLALPLDTIDHASLAREAAAIHAAFA